MFTVNDNRDGTWTIQYQDDTHLTTIGTIPVEDEAAWALAVAKLTA